MTADRAGLVGAVAAAEAEKATRYREYREALHRFGQANMRLLYARLDLEEAQIPTPANEGERP